MSNASTTLSSQGKATVEVDLSLEEVLEACRQYKDDKRFEQDIDSYYNDSAINSWDYWSEGSIK